MRLPWPCLAVMWPLAVGQYVLAGGIVPTTAPANARTSVVPGKPASEADADADKIDGQGDKDAHLFAAAVEGNLTAVKTLLASGADVDAASLQDCSPLSAAICNGHKDIAMFLLRSGANVNPLDVGPGLRHPSPLQLSLVTPHMFDVGALLLEKGAKVRLDGYTVLHWAAGHGYAKGISWLLQRKAIGVDARDAVNNTALHWAALLGETAVVRELLKHGANRRLKNELGDTPHVARALGRLT